MQQVFYVFNEYCLMFYCVYTIYNFTVNMKTNIEGLEMFTSARNKPEGDVIVKHDL